MFDKRLFKELFKIKGYFIIETAAAIVAVSLTICQGLLIASLINNVFLKRAKIGNVKHDLIILVLVIVIKALLNGILEYYNRKTAIKIKRGFRGRFIEGIIGGGPMKLRNEKTGRLSAIFEEGIEAFEPFYSEFVPQMFLAVVEIPVILTIVFLKDPLSFGIMLITAPLIPVFMMLIGKMASYMSSRQWKSLQRMSGHFLDVLKGLSTLKLFGREESQGKIIEAVSENFRETTMSVLKISFLSALVLELVATISTAMLAVTLGVRLLYGKIEFVNAFFILLMAPEYYQPLRQLGAKFHAAMGAKTAADSVFPILENYIINDSLSVFNMTNEDGIDISINELSYSYDGENKALDNIKLHINKNIKFSLTGPSGGGKSTFIAIIMGFIKDYSGSIKVNGIELNTMDRDNWSNYYAYVPQHPKLFKTSILENIRISKPSASISEVEKIIEVIGLKSLINNFPEGANTSIGEGGRLLSGGQIQLIAIGRALLKDTPLIILDEPTSSLDIDFEKKINDAFISLFPRKTVITIAHRLPTIRKSDYILILEKGKVVEAGSTDSLIKLQGYYSDLMAAGEGE